MGVELPSGTLTFLFTDIEGSTRLWQDDREAAGDAVRRHDALMSDAVESHGGYVFNTAGDSFAVAFGRAGDALAAAVEAQRRLTDEPWPGPAIRVRMGLHTGEVEERDGDYFGPAANTGARVCAAGHGGQILFTTAVDEIVDTERTDLGEYQLRDITRPLSLFQVEAHGLETDFPPVRSLDATRSRRRRWITAAVVALVVAVGAGVLVLAGGDESPRGETAASGGASTGEAPPTPELVATIRVGPPADFPFVSGPMDVISADGSIWTNNPNDVGTLTRIDPETNEVVDTISVGPLATSIAADNTFVYVVLLATGDLFYVDQGDNRVLDPIPDVGPLKFPIAIAEAARLTGPGTVAVGEGGIWVINDAGDADEIVRVAPRAREIVARIPVGRSPAAVAAGEGAVWVSNGDDGTVSRIDPETNEVVATISTGQGPKSVATGHGSVWVSNRNDNTVSRIDPETNEVVAEIPVGRFPTAIFVSNAAVWVANTDDDTVSRIDPQTNEVTTTIDVGDRPLGVVVSDGALWVAAFGAKAVERYEPAD